MGQKSHLPSILLHPMYISPAEALAATVDEGVKTDVEDQIALHCARLHHRYRGTARVSGCAVGMCVGIAGVS